MAIRNKLMSLDLRLTELCNYLQVSRPTMYRYIELYDNKEFNDIDTDVLNVFNYINDNKLIGKMNVIDYIINNVVQSKNEDDTVKIIKNYISNNPRSNKTKFFELLTKTNEFDSLISYLIKIEPLLSKSKLTKAEKELLKPYELIIKGEK